ncbi:unnamed protein product [Rhizophagus irregularis]|nr:unnamed protein product [Rhizophagus irregularis]
MSMDVSSIAASTVVSGLLTMSLRIFLKNLCAVNSARIKLCNTPTALPIILQNSQTAAIVLHSIKNNIDNEMPMLLFHWNDLGFNDVPTSPNLRNEVIGQLQQAIVANLIANRAIDYRNHGLLFIFPNDTTIGTWARNVSANISPL